MRTCTISSVKISFECVPRSARCGSRRHISVKSRRYTCSSARSALAVERYVKRLAVPTSVKRRIFRFIPISNALHFGVVILNAVCIVITCKIVARICRSGCRGHCRIICCAYRVCSVYTTVFVKRYGISICFPFRINVNDCAIFTRKIKHFLFVYIQSAAPVAICRPPLESVTR